MPRPIARCQAPRAYQPEVPCDKPFIQTVPTKLYCSVTCARRAQAIARRQRNHGLDDNFFRAMRTFEQHEGLEPTDAPEPAPAAPALRKETGEEILRKIGITVPTPRSTPYSAPDFGKYEEPPAFLDYPDEDRASPDLEPSAIPRLEDL